MKLSSHLSRRSLVACASAAGLAVLAFHANAAQFSVVASADAEIREDTPKTNRDGGLGATSNVNDAQAQLQIINSGSAHRYALVKFSLAGITDVSQLENYADLRVFWRLSSSVQGGLRVYGLNPGAARSNWSEASVFYRDSGPNFPVTQPNPGVGGSAAADPVAPIILGGANYYGADANNANNAPGLVFERAPYSANVDSTNQTRYAANQTLRASYLTADMADDGQANGSAPTAPYQTYLAQPANYTQLNNANGYTDLNGSDIPFSTSIDADPSATSYLGYMTFPNTAKVLGSRLSFTNNDSGVTNTAQAQLDSNETQLYNFLAAAITASQTSVTFIITPTVAGDAVASGSALQLSSKDFDPDGAGPLAAGAYGPTLVLAPEPGSLTLAGLATIGLFGRRRRD